MATTDLHNQEAAAFTAHLQAAHTDRQEVAALLVLHSDEARAARTEDLKVLLQELLPEEATLLHLQEAAEVLTEQVR